MVLNGVKENVSSNVGESKSFNIEANSAAFQILADKLYKYPIRAIVREGAANAIDAHRVIKKPLNEWELTIPNSINPTFAIEDHGVGMDDDEINEIYTTFFKSTKSSSNDQTGMFGLGSKTPFSYTKQFIVESSKNGFKNIYSMHSENGIPEVARINPEPIPTDKTGTKISFAVKKEDFYEFYDAIITSSATWPGLPKMNGSDEFFSYVRRKIYSNLSGLQILENTNKIYSSKEIVPGNEDKSFINLGNRAFSLEMGNVLYYVSLENINIPSEFVHYANSSHNSSGIGYIIHANIGDVSITPNREDLQYDKKTVEFLKKRIVSIIAKNYKFSIKNIKSEIFKSILKLDMSSVTPEAWKEIQNLNKAYNKELKKINFLTKKIENEKKMFLIYDKEIRYNNKCLKSPWYSIGSENYSTFYEQAAVETLIKFEELGKKGIRLVPLNERVFNRYKVNGERDITGFFYTRVNRMNRDNWAKLNGITDKNFEPNYRFNQDYHSPLFFFCLDSEVETLKKAIEIFKDVEVIENFEKLPNSFDDKEIVDKASIDFNSLQNFNLDIGSGTGKISLNDLKQNYKNTKIIVALENGRNYQFMDLHTYTATKSSIDNFISNSKYYRAYEISNILREINKDSVKYAILTGKPSDIKKAKFASLGLKIDLNPDIGNILTSLSDKIITPMIEEIENMQSEFFFEKIVSKEFKSKMESILDSNSKFRKFIEDIEKKCDNIELIKTRRAKFENMRRFTSFASISLKERINKAYTATKETDFTGEIKEKIRTYPLGDLFLDRNYYSYSSDYWSSYTPFGDFFKIVKLTETN